jgi:hypothetical protein
MKPPLYFNTMEIFPSVIPIDKDCYNEHLPANIGRESMVMQLNKDI